MKKVILSIFAILVLSSIVYAQAVNVCCEKTINDAWCQNTEEANCDTSFMRSPSNCESTSFCKQGCCFDSEEGICMENTPKRVCDENGGAWSDSKDCQIDQCELGCCIIGDHASLATLTRCRRLSLLYNLEINYKADIKSEDVCIEQTRLNDVGACVYETEEFERKCYFGTRQECKALSGSRELSPVNICQTLEGNKLFCEDALCSNEDLATVCAPQVETACFDGKVHWVDSCGNKENIYYFPNKEGKERSYNNGFVLSLEEFEQFGCSREDALDNPACGNCDYLAGSTCSQYNRGQSSKPNAGDYICKDLNCYSTSNGQDYKHGESWCIYDNQFDSVGSRHWKHICIDGEEILEPCGDFRNQICIQADIEVEGIEFTEASCRANRWQFCHQALDQEGCSNTDKGDCTWLPAIGDIPGKCIPTYSPGIMFWQPGEAQQLCATASVTCTVVMEKGLFDDDWECAENCECLEDYWAERMNDICAARADCGGKINILNAWGGGYNWKEDDLRKYFGEAYIRSKVQPRKEQTITGNIIKSLLS